MNKKKILVAILCAAVVLSFAACGKKNENKSEEKTGENAAQTENADNAAQENKTEDDGIEYGGDIDENGNVSYDKNVSAKNKNNAPAAADNKTNAQENTENKITIERDANGNVTQKGAIVILQKYTTEQLGLEAGIEYQLLFDESKSDVNGKECYVIAAKKPGENTQGVFYVSLDGNDVYKYDIDNAKYIKLP